MEPFEEIDVNKSKMLIDQGGLTVIDIRGKERFEAGHIKHAKIIDDGNIEEFVQTADKNKPVLCYCHMGFSSQAAAQYLKDQGFRTVYSMAGGITEWQKSYEVVVN